MTDVNGCEDSSNIISFSVGVKNISNNDDISVYPNPLEENILYLNFINAASEKISINIYDISGRKLSSSYCMNDITIALDLSDYKDGTYYLEIRDSKGVIIKKIIKL
jgi:hypothetical protein